MTISRALSASTTKLESHSSSPRLDAELLLAHLLTTDRAALLQQSREHLQPDQEENYHSLVESRRQGWPVAYLTNHQAFGGLSLYVNPDVLIPRPATELLVDEIVRQVAPAETVRIADIGTGSGAIALALALRLPQAQIVASDVSAQALSIAHYNARHSQLTNRITFLHGSLLEPFHRVPGPDVIVANLPYLRPDQFSELSIQKEPRLALAGGRDGLRLVWRLLDQVHEFHPWQGLVLELHPDQIETVGNYLASQWPHYDLNYISDGQDNRGVAMWSDGKKLR